MKFIRRMWVVWCEISKWALVLYFSHRIFRIVWFAVENRKTIEQVNEMWRKVQDEHNTETRTDN